MFVSQHRSLVHHTPGSLPTNTTHKDPSKHIPVTNQSFAAARSVVSNKFVSQPTGTIRAGTGRQTTTSAPSTFAPSVRAFPNDAPEQAPAATNQTRFGSIPQQQQASSSLNRSSFAATAGIPPSNTTGAINRNATVKFQFKKPQLPATISSSSALYHFSTSANSSQSNSLSKFAIPKLSASSAVQNGDQSSLSGGGKSAATTSAPSFLDQSPTTRVSSAGCFAHNRQISGGASQPHQPNFTFSKHHYGSQAKSKSTSKSSANSSAPVGNKEAQLFAQQNEFKSSKTSVGSALGTSASASSSSVHNISQQISAKSEHANTKKSSKVFSASSSQQANSNIRPPPSAMFTKESKETSKSSASYSASATKKDSLTTVKSKSSSRTETSSKNASSDKKKSKSSKNIDQIESPESVKKSKKETRDNGAVRVHNSYKKVKTTDDESSSTPSKLKSKDKEQKGSSSRKDRKRRQLDQLSDESEESEHSDDDAAVVQHDPFVKPKAKRRRHNSDSSTSSQAGGANDSLLKTTTDEAAYTFNPRAAATMAKSSQDPTKMYSSKEVERNRQKLADSGHFPSLLHNSKQSPSPSNLFSSSNMASPSMSDSLSPPISQKMISAKIPHLHEDGSTGCNNSAGGLVTRKENSNSLKKSKSSKDMSLNNSSSGTETSHLLQTRIKYRDDNSVTTIEIKSFNKEKTWENDFKKMKSSKESSSKSSSSSTKVVGPSRHEASNLQESSKLSASNLSVSSNDSSTTSTKKSKKSSSTKEQQENGKSAKKSSKSDETSKKRKKRDHSSSPSRDEKMPPPLIYPPASYSKYSSAPSCDSLYSDNNLAVVKGSLGSKLDHRNRSKSPASSCSSSSEIPPYQPAPISKGSKKQTLAEMCNRSGGAMGQLEKSNKRHHSRRRDHDSDDSDEDDKMSTISSRSASSASSRSSSSSALSSISSTFSPKKEQTKSGKKTVSKEYSKKDRISSKASIKLSDSIKKERRSKKKIEIKDNDHPFEYSKKQKTKSKKQQLNLSSDSSSSESESDSASDDGEHNKPKVSISSGSESDGELSFGFGQTKNVPPYKHSPHAAKKANPKAKDEKLRKSKLGESLAESQKKKSAKNGQSDKYSPIKRGNGGNTGLSDSDSSSDEDDPVMHDSLKPTISRAELVGSDLSASSSESESEDEKQVTTPPQASLTVPNNRTPSPHLTPNSRLLPASNIYSRANPPLISSPFERLYQNIGYGTERHTSLSPPMFSFTSSTTTTTSLSTRVSFSFMELQEMQSRICQLADSELLQRIIDLIEERHRHCLHIGTDSLRFDLLKLDQATLVEIKRLIN